MLRNLSLAAALIFGAIYIPAAAQTVAPTVAQVSSPDGSITLSVDTDGDKRAEQYIDFAAAHNFRGVLIEGWNKGWNGDWLGHGDEYDFTTATPDFDLKAVTDYARSKNVHLIGHHETGGNIAVYEAQLDAALQFYGALGVDVVKTGYVADADGIAPDK